ncbi:hypothetical protein [Blastococcus sp. SYSU DS1021]
MPQPQVPPSPWAIWLAGSAAAGIGRVDALSELIWATDRINGPHVHGTRPGGRPVGFPDKVTARAAGAELLDLLDDRPDPDGADPARRMLGLVGRHTFAQHAGRPSPDDEVQTRSRVLRQGLDRLRRAAPDDVALLAWANWKTALAARVARDHEAALADLVMEAARRDRVGSLLAQLATTPGVSARIRETAETVLAANAAVPVERGGTSG